VRIITIKVVIHAVNSKDVDMFTINSAGGVLRPIWAGVITRFLMVVTRY